MIDPAQHVGDVMDFRSLGQVRTVDHQDGQPQHARGGQLGLGTTSAGILADDQIDRLCAQQRCVGFHGEGTAIDDDVVVRQRDVFPRRIDEAQQIVVLRLSGEGIDMHPPQRQHHPPRRAGERGDGTGDVRNPLPAITRLRVPRGAGQREMRDADLRGGGDRVGAYLCGERVRGIHQMRDIGVAQIGYEAFDPAEAANPNRHWLRLRVRDPARIAQRGGKRALRQRGGERAGFGGAAEDQDVRHG